MSVITLAPQDFANKMRLEDMVLLPVSLGGFVYGVVKGGHDQNIYRVAVA